MYGKENGEDRLLGFVQCVQLLWSFYLQILLNLLIEEHLVKKAFLTACLVLGKCYGMNSKDKQ